MISACDNAQCCRISSSRKRFLLPASVLSLCLLLPAFSYDAFALRCGSSLVEIGDRKLEVLRICGKPVFIETWTDETAILMGDDERDLKVSHILTAHLEEWTYNFGPQRFISFLTFVDGKLERIEDGPKGFSGDFPRTSNRPRCASLVSDGDRKIEVLMKCGKPDAIEDFGEDRVSVTLDKLKVQGIFRRHGLLAEVEEWTYNLGPLEFLLFIKFENGRVVKTEQGDYGY